MKKVLKNAIQMFLICTFVFSFTAFAQSTTTHSDEYTQMFAFGDSYSDNGEGKRISTAIVNSDNAPKGSYIKPSDELYWNNRYSNGYTTVEVFAQKLGLDLTNYATGGGTTGEENYSPWMDCLGGTGVLGQIDKFEKDLDGAKADPDALYYIFASANDYFTFMDYNQEGSIRHVADRAVTNIEEAIVRLHNLGAKNFFIVNSSDLTLVPYEITNNRTDSAEQFVNNVNKKLPKTIKNLRNELDATIMYFDITKISDKIMENPSKYGLKVLDTPCQNTYPEVKPVNENPEQYYFWDEWHYSAAVHNIFGSAMYERIKNF